MSEMDNAIERSTSWRSKALALGAFLGALVGALAAYLYIQSQEDDTPPELTPGEGVKLGVLVFGLLRSIASLGEGRRS